MALTPKHQSGYLYEKALESIKLFGLDGDSEEAERPNDNVRALRITLLHSHYKRFERFLKCFEADDVVAMRKEVTHRELDKFGFFQFILRRQYNLCFNG